MYRRSLALLLLAGVAVLASVSCTKDYVTGKSTFNLMSESSEVALGKEADPQIVAEYGLYDDANLTAYVDGIGQSIARVSQRPNLQYTFRVVDSPIVNAFALPGGYVYFTRGILAHFNSEAELAGVMGHEIGHVVARHGAEQQSKAQLAQLGLGLGNILSEDFRRISGAAELGLSLIFLKFSRSQESESDLLGVEYSTKLGYDAREMAGFFRTIARLSDDGGGRMPVFLSTHPDPGQRETRVAQLAAEWQAKIPFTPKTLDRKDYLRMIDGIVFGEDPRQGFVENNVFYHPELRFQFPVPAKWALMNSPSVVQMMNAEKNAMIEFSLGRGDSPKAAASSFVQNAQAQVIREQATRVHGLPAHEVESQVQTQNNVLHLFSYFIQKGNAIYVFHGYTTNALYPTHAATFKSVMVGFDELRNQAALQKQPLRVRIERVEKAGDLATVLRGYRTEEKMLSELAILNGMTVQDQVKRGDYIKVVR